MAFSEAKLKPFVRDCSSVPRKLRHTSLAKPLLFPWSPLFSWSLFFHGSRRNVWRVWAATAAGVKGSAKVVPLYQSFH